jgi:excisionase family DNA binding protein
MTSRAQSPAGDPSTLPSAGGDHRPAALATEFVTIEELARILRVPKATVYRWRSTGDGPKGYTIGRYVRFRWTDVEIWLQERSDQHP